MCNKPDQLLNEKEHLRKALTHCKYPKQALDKVEKRLTKSLIKVSNWVDSQGNAGTQPATNDVKIKGHIVIPYTQGLCKASKRSAVGMVYRPTSKLTAPLRTYWSPTRTEIPWSTKVGPSTGSNVGASHAMMST